MKTKGRTKDLILLVGLALILAGLPLGLRAYDAYFWQSRIPGEAKVFTLTGHAAKGWQVGEVRGLDVVDLWRHKGGLDRPVIEVHKGDLVVFKLKSSDVTHGFSFKDFNIFVSDGIEPGKIKLVKFRADKAGRFIFSCNSICGEGHKDMQGVLVVKA